jgi:hypothetical protein
MVSKKVKIAGIGLGVIIVSYLIYKYLIKRDKGGDDGKNVGSILKDAFDNLSFQFNSYKIDSDSYPFLDELSSVLLAQPSWKLELAGHTDNKGSEATNLAMSKGRVEEVRKYLVSKGVPIERVTTFAYGESKPIASNDTEDGRAKNRRVEMKIVKSDGTALNVEDKSTLIDVEKNEVVSKDKPNSKPNPTPKKPNSTSNINQGSNKPKTDKKPKVNPNRAKAITIKGVKIYVSDDAKGRLVFEDGSRIGEYKVNAKVTLLGVTAWSGSVAVAKIFKYSNGSVKIVDNTGKDFDGEDTDLVPLVNQFKEGKKNLVASIGKANLNLQKMA